MARVFLGLGSNMGFRYANLAKGLRLLRGIGSFRRKSAVRETAPVGPERQPPYLNMVVEMVTDLSPMELVRRTKEIERAVGRTATYRWGPRALDIDLLLYDEEKIDLPWLKVPHPRMRERAFVMEPLAEIAPDKARGKTDGP
jgi:2-amino-4-hydroxy-6-hydroxymethyldihydropteridine diphosphokinase